MKKILTIIALSWICMATFAKDYQVYGPQGGLAMTITLPKGFDTATDTCPMVILMHGIFASQRITPMPTIARQLAQAGIASIRFNFGGHWSSEGEMVKMTIENEIHEAMAMWQYACSLPYVSKIGLLGHSQGGVVASMTAGRIAASESAKQPLGLVLIAPASVLKPACQKGHLLGAKFNPVDPPTFVRCFGMMKVGREYILSTQLLDIYGTAASYHGPVRIIHGSEDTLVPMWCSEDFLKTYGGAAQLMVVDNENHRISRRTRHVATLVTEFFSAL